MATYLPTRKGGGLWAFSCDNCGKESIDRASQYLKKKRHFCSTKCYAEYRRNWLPPEEQNSYKNGGLPDKEKERRRKARSDLNHAVKQGRVRRPEYCAFRNCQREPEAHHHDYDFPLDVHWLCRVHHRLIHENPELLKV